MSDTKVRKKLIEVSIPLDAINAASSREKSIRHGHPSTLHLWWARRPLAACRAVLFAQLVDDPSAWPERFPTVEAQEVERLRLHDVIAAIVPWEASNDLAVLNEARFEIARSIAWGRGEEPPPISDPAVLLDYLQAFAPPVYDPFCGGGSIPLEAQRLGLRAIGSDLNPVAVLISKALVEIPPKFAGRPPVNPEARDKRLIDRSWTGARGLAEDVRYYGRWIRQEAQRRIGHLYPDAQLPDGTGATVIAWLWARTVRSPDPAAKGAMVPLVSSFLLTTKEGNMASVQPVLDPAAPEGYRFEVQSGAVSKSDEERLKKGTKGVGRGSAFLCLLTGSTIKGDYIKAEAQVGRMSARLMAMVAECPRGRAFLSPTSAHEAVAASLVRDERMLDARAGGLSQPVPERLTGGTCYAYGLTTFDRLFTPRQLVALTTLSDLVTEVREKVLADAPALGLPDDAFPLHKGGAGVSAYADAITTYLGFAISRMADRHSSLTRWDPNPSGYAPKIANTFARQALPMVWDYTEGNPFSSSSGNFEDATQWIAKNVDTLGAFGNGTALQIDAAKNNYPVQPIIISTDPPYYGNIGYADLSDFFYVWLRRTLGNVWPDLFRRLNTPKDPELVATPYRHGGKGAAEAFFMHGMGEALVAMRKAAVDDVPLAIYYAFKQAEVAEDGIVSAGWATFLQAVVDAGLSIDGTWPIRTELSNRMVGSGTNALASSIVLVCRKRKDAATTSERDAFVRALRRELPDALAQIRAGGVGPVDMAQAAIGPGMGVFTRYAAVLEDSGEAMKVRTALAMINQARDEIDTDDDASYDLETRFALDWFSETGWEATVSGRAILAANARNLSLDGLVHAGLITTQGGKTRLIRRDEMPVDYASAFDKEPIVWKAAQHLARALTAEDGGQDKAAAIMGHLTGRETVRALAYRLYGLCERKNWSAEALVWNRVAEEWRTIEDRAATMPRAADGMPDLFEAAR